MYPQRKRNTQKEGQVLNELSEYQDNSTKISNKTQKNRQRITLDYFYDDLLDYALVLGMTPEQYWYGNPRLLLNYEKKYQDEMLRKRQEAWLFGAYVKSAVSSTILVAGLADKDTSKKMPKYPDMPMPTNDDGEVEMSETAKELERERFYRYLHKLAKINNKKGV